MAAKPTALLEATGAYKKNPARRRKGEPKPRLGIGRYPESVVMTPKEVWDELVENICPGVLGNSDRILLETTSHLLSQFRSDPVEFPAAKLTILERCLGKLGMTPVDRTRIVAEQEEAVSPEDEFFG